MERLTNKREADAQREEYERRLANGYPRNIPEERFLRLAAYEDTGLMPEEVLPKDKADEIALKLMRLADLESLCSYDHLRELAEADKEGRVLILPCKVGDTVFALIGYAREPRECKVEFVNIGNGYTTIILRTADDAREQCGVPLPAFGRTVFLTREEAEKAMKGATEK